MTSMIRNIFAALVLVGSFAFASASAHAAPTAVSGSFSGVSFTIAVDGYTIKCQDKNPICSGENGPVFLRVFSIDGNKRKPEQFINTLVKFVFIRTKVDGKVRELAFEVADWKKMEEFKGFPSAVQNFKPVNKKVGKKEIPYRQVKVGQDSVDTFFVPLTVGPGKVLRHHGIAFVPMPGKSTVLVFIVRGKKDEPVVEETGKILAGFSFDD